MTALSRLLLKFEQDLHHYLDTESSEIECLQSYGLPTVTAEIEELNKVRLLQIEHLEKGKCDLATLQLSKDNLQKAHDALKEMYAQKIEALQSAEAKTQELQLRNQDLQQQLRITLNALEKLRTL